MSIHTHERTLCGCALLARVAVAISVCLAGWLAGARLFVARSRETCMDGLLQTAVVEIRMEALSDPEAGVGLVPLFDVDNRVLSMVFCS